VLRWHWLSTIQISPAAQVCTASSYVIHCLVASCLMVVAMCCAPCCTWAGSSVGTSWTTNSHQCCKRSASATGTLGGIYASGEASVRFAVMQVHAACSQSTNRAQATCAPSAPMRADTASYICHGFSPCSKKKVNNTMREIHQSLHLKCISHIWVIVGKQANQFCERAYRFTSFRMVKTGTGEMHPLRVTCSVLVGLLGCQATKAKVMLSQGLLLAAHF